MYYHVLKIISLQQITLFLCMIFISEVRWLSIFVNAQRLENDWENTLSGETSSLDPSITSTTNIDSFSAFQDDKSEIFTSENQEKYTISTQTNAQDNGEYREKNLNSRSIRKSNSAENSESDSDSPQYDLDTQTYEFRDVSDETLTTTTSNDYDQKENSIDKESSGKDFNADINPLVVIDVGDSKKNGSHKKTYTFDRRQAEETEVDSKDEVLHFSTLPLNDSKGGSSKKFSAKKLINGQVHKHDKVSMKNYNSTDNNTKPSFPPSESNKNEKANKKSDSNKREIYPFNDKNFYKPNINRLTNEKFKNEIPNSYQNPEWMSQKDLLTNNNNVFENQNEYDNTYNRNGKIPNMTHYPQANQNIRNYENNKILNYDKSFPDKSNFISKDDFDNTPNELTKILSVKQTYFINKNEEREPKESKNVYKNLFPHKISSVNSNSIRNMPGKLNYDSLGETSNFEIKPLRNSFEVANKNLNSQMYSPIFKLGKDNPLSKLVIRREEEKTEHINENVNKNAELMHIKPPPVHFVEFIRPEWLETSTENREFSTYNTKLTSDRTDGIPDNTKNKSSFNKQHMKKSKNKINAPIKTKAHSYSKYKSAQFNSNSNINKSKTDNVLINKSRETDNRSLSNKPKHGKNRLLKNKLKLQAKAENIRNQTPKVNSGKIPTISHVRYRNVYNKIPKFYGERKRQAFGKNIPKYFPSIKENYTQENQHLLNEDSMYSVPSVDSNLHLEKFLSNRTMHDTNLVQSDKPHQQKLKNEVSSSLVETAPHKFNETEMGNLAPNVEYAGQPIVQTVNGLIDMPSYQFVEPKLESEQLKNRREYSVQSEQKPAFHIDEKGNVQIVKPEKNGENILPQFSSDRDLQAAAYRNPERYPTYIEKNNYPLKTQDKFNDFNRMIEKNDKGNSLVDLEQAFQPDVDQSPDFEAERQPSSHLNIRPALNANEEAQNGETPLSNRKQYDYFQGMQSQITPVSIPQNKISFNKVHSPDAMQSQLKIQIPPYENLADAQPINEDFSNIGEGSFTNYENNVLKEPQFNNHEGKFGSEMSIANEMGTSDNKNTAKEIKTISKKIEESVQIEKHMPLTNKESPPYEDDLVRNNEYDLGGLKNDKITQASLLDDENPYQSLYSSTNEPEYEFNTENLNKAYAEFQKDLNQMKPFTDYSSDKSEQMESEFYSANPIKNIQNNYENEHLPYASKVQLGLENEEDPWLTTSSDEKFETDQSNPRIAAVEYSDMYLLDNGKNNKYEHVNNINQPIRKLVKVSEIEVFSPKKLNDSKEVIKDIDKLERVLRNSENAKDEANAKLGKNKDTNENNSHIYSHQFSTEVKSFSEEQNFNEQPEMEDYKNLTANDDSYFRTNKIRKLFSFTYSHEKDKSIKINNTKTDLFRDTKAFKNVTDLIFERTNNYCKLKCTIRPFIRYIVRLVEEFMKILAIISFYIFIAMLIVLLVFIINRIAVLYSNKDRRRCHIYNINSVYSEV